MVYSMTERTQTKTEAELKEDIYSPGRFDYRQAEHPFTVAMSVTTVGPSRETEGWKNNRVTLAGNMARAYTQPGEEQLEQARLKKKLTSEQKANMSRVAEENKVKFIESLGYNPSNTFGMHPQSSFAEDLGIINVDDASMLEDDFSSKLAPMQPKQGDFLYTRDPEKVLGCCPADCPVLGIKGIDNEGKDILAMLHVGWQGLNAGYLEQGMNFLRTQGVDFSTLRIYVGPSAHKESYPYKSDEDPRKSDEDLSVAKSSRFTHPDRDKLFVDVHENQSMGTYNFKMDMGGFIHNMLTSPDRIALDPWQVAYDGSDTANFDSGYSSNSRPRLIAEQEENIVEENGRSLIVISLKNPYSNQKPA